jgi:hypothetical protein
MQALTKQDSNSILSLGKHIASDDATRPTLGCVVVIIKNESAVAVATDGLVLACHALQTRLAMPDGRYGLPYRQIKRALGLSLGIDGFEMLSKDGLAKYSYHAGPFPQYQKVIPSLDGSWRQCQETKTSDPSIITRICACAGLESLYPAGVLSNVYRLEFGENLAAYINDFLFCWMPLRWTKEPEAPDGGMITSWNALREAL